MRPPVVHAVLEGSEACTEQSLGDTARLPGGDDLNKEGIGGKKAEEL